MTAIKTYNYQFEVNSFSDLISHQLSCPILLSNFRVFDGNNGQELYTKEDILMRPLIVRFSHRFGLSELKTLIASLMSSSGVKIWRTIQYV
jgi:hypothetical protein